LVSVASL
jgi:bifunctional UDP-N-acetylglucosamine pyrophosphorylase/glucosamine-1-phosphate N-acetyltransferase